MPRAIRSRPTSVKPGTGLLLVLVLGHCNPGFSDHRQPVSRQYDARPYIQSVYPQTCDRRGGTIVIHGRNLKSPDSYTLSARAGHRRLRLQILAWNTNRIIAVIPRHAPLPAGSRLLLGLSRHGDRRWLSNRGAGLTVCRTARATGDTPSPPAGTGAYAPRQVLVLTPGRRQAERLQQRLRRHRFRVRSRKHYPALGLQLSVLTVPAGLSVPAAIQQLRRRYPSYTIDANHRFRLHTAGSDGRRTDNRQRAIIGWGPVQPGCGRGIKLGLMDTGIDATHRLLRGRAIVNRSFLPASVDPAPQGHATAIASIWLGKRSGLTPAARVYVAAVFGRHRNRLVSTNTKWLLDGLDWLVRQRVDVINMSFGGPRNHVLAQAIGRARSKGIMFVASAGNDGPNAPPAYPAAYRGVIAVTAVDNRLRLYRKANRGRYVDFSAPGVNVAVARPGNQTRIVSGTSFAAPYVSVAIALLKKRDPARQAQLLHYLRTTSRDLGVRGKDPLFGWGLLQMHGACR